MKSILIALAACMLVPSLAWGQGPRPCAPKAPSSVMRPYFQFDYEGYQGDECRQQQRGLYAQNSTAGGVPITVRNMIRTLDCFIPCGPKSGHGCGITCIGAGSGCLWRHCDRDITYCPNCGARPLCCECCETCPSYARGGPVIHRCQFEPAYEPLLAPSHSHTDKKTAP